MAFLLEPLALPVADFFVVFAAFLVASGFALAFFAADGALRTDEAFTTLLLADFFVVTDFFAPGLRLAAFFATAEDFEEPPAAVFFAEGFLLAAFFAVVLVATGAFETFFIDVFFFAAGFLTAVLRAGAFLLAVDFFVAVLATFFALTVFAAADFPLAFFAAGFFTVALLALAFLVVAAFFAPTFLTGFALAVFAAVDFLPVAFFAGVFFFALLVLFLLVFFVAMMSPQKGYAGAPSWRPHRYARQPKLALVCAVVSDDIVRLDLR